MASTPLSHHDILALVEPFTRRGRHVDLPASDRMERRLRFKPVEHAGEPALLDTLQLDSFESGSFQLTRTLSRCDSLHATLQIGGPDPAALLAQVEAVAPPHQFVAGPGFVIARSYSLQRSVLEQCTE